MVWCGDDCIVLYFPKKRQFGVYVGGPNNEWLPFSYDNPVRLVPEVDGVRILGPLETEMLQRVPASTESIYKLGSTEPAAMLCYAHERFEAGDVRAEESVRYIKDNLREAIDQCFDA